MLHIHVVHIGQTLYFDPVLFMVSWLSAHFWDNLGGIDLYIIAMYWFQVLIINNILQ